MPRPWLAPWDFMVSPHPGMCDRPSPEGENVTGVPLSSSPIPRRSILIGTVGMAAAALASCDKASSSTSSTSANATSRTVTLSIAANEVRHS